MWSFKFAALCLLLSSKLDQGSCLNLHLDTLDLDALPEDIVDGLPEDVSIDELQETSIRALESMIEKLFHPVDVQARSLFKRETYPCNTMIETLRAADLRATAVNLVDPEVEDLAYSRALLFMLDMLLFANLKHDIQVWKVCGRCSDFEPAIGVACEEHEYGYNATQSGLLIAPYNIAVGHIYESTLPVNILSSSGVGSVPSELWTKPLWHPLPLIGAFLTAGSRTYTIIPDNMGTGESEDHYKAFLIRQSLATGIAPVLWQSEAIVSQESNCASALGDAFVVSGYSEGGYGAVAVADALSRMGKTIIACHAGGGAYRLSSSTVMSALKDVRGGNKHMTYYMALLGAALSSTTTDAVNYGQGEDFIDQNWRDLLVDMVQYRSDQMHPIKVVIPDEDPISVFSKDLVSVIETGMANGEAEPCLTSVTNRTTAICQALRDQDLVEILESANYPVYLCHSHEDEIIPYDNLPDMNSNPNLHLKTVGGDHFPAGASCIVANLLYIANDNNVQNFPVQEKACSGGCGCEPPAPQELATHTEDPTTSCNFLYGIFGLKCHVGKRFSGLGFLGIDFSW